LINGYGGLDIGYLYFKVKPDTMFLKKGEVGTRLDYGVYLEFGGRSFLRRGVKANLANIGWAFVRGAKGGG